MISWSRHPRHLESVLQAIEAPENKPLSRQLNLFPAECWSVVFRENGEEPTTRLSRALLETPLWELNLEDCRSDILASGTRDGATLLGHSY